MKTRLLPILAACWAIALAGCGGSAPASKGTLTASTSSLTFASTVVGASSATQSVTFNVAGGSVTPATPVLTGAAAASYAVTSTCGGTLPAGGSCTATVKFAPTAGGTLNAALSVASDAGSGSPLTIALSGTGVPLAPVAVFSSNSIDFGGQTVNAPAISRTVTLTNSGNLALTLSAVSLAPTAGPYSLSGTCVAGASVAPGASCTLVVAFAPTAPGAQAATLTVASNAAGSPQSLPVTGTAYNGRSFTGVVSANGQPVTGASVQLYAAGATGRGSVSTALLSAPLTTDGTGAFTVPSAYICATATTQLYLLSSGGVAAGTSQAANPALTLLNALGACSAIVPGARATVNEATTVAGAYTLAPFYTGPAAIGATATNATGLANAFISAAELASPTTGAIPGTGVPANVALPTPRIAALANIVSACAYAPSACGTFQGSQVTSAGATPANVLDALVNLARTPAGSVAVPYAVSLQHPYFTPALTAVPTDWTLFATISGGGMNSPSQIGVDSTGSLWVANYFNVASKFSPAGAAVFPTGITGFGLYNSYGLAIDLNDNVWIPNEQPFIKPGTIGSVTELTPAGAPLSGAAGYTDGGPNYPLSVAIDPNGTTWVVDYGNSHLTLLNASGVSIAGPAGYTSPLFAFPVVVAVDANHFGWVGNQADSTVTKVAPDGSKFTNYDCCQGASGLAIDQGNNVWVANFYGDSVSLISSTGAIVSKGYTAGGSILRPQGIAVDGAGAVWVANYRTPYLVKLAGATAAVPGAALSPATGLGADARLLTAYALVIDASGNIWVSNQGSDTVTKFFGLAVPVKTPLSGVVQTP